MKKLIIAYLFTITNVLSAPPTYFNGELQTNTYIQNIKAPNYQTTPLGGIDRRLETGNLNELQNPNFEHSTVSTGWTISNATASGNTTNPLEGKKSISLALTGALSLSQSSTINAAQKSGVQMVASIWVNSSDVSDLQLCSLKNGSEDKCTVSGGYTQGSGWRQLTVSFIGNATSNGLKLKSTDTTGTVLVDQAYVGIGSPIVDFTTTTDWETYTPTVSNTTNATATGFYRRVGGDLEIDVKVTWSGSGGSAQGPIVTIPSVGVIDTTKLASTNTKPLGTGSFLNLGNSVYPGYSLYASTTTIGAGTFGVGTNNDIGIFLNTTPKSGDYFSFRAKVPIAGWAGKSSKAYVASSSDYGWTSFIPTSPNSSLTLSASSCYHKREGEDLLIDCRALVSSPQASEMRISLPNNLTMSNNVYSLLKQCGSYYRTEGSINSTKNGAIICEAGFNYVRFSLDEYANTNSPFVAQNANNVIANGQTLTFTARIPIQGWQDSGVIVGSFQGYNETPGVSAPKLFSFRVTTTSGVVANNRGGYVTSCTAANPTVCTLTGLSSAPTCSTTITGASSGGNNAVQNALATSTSLNIYTYTTSTGSASASQPVEVVCHGN